MSALQSVWFIYAYSDVWHVHFYLQRSGNEKYSENSLFVRRVVTFIQQFRTI